jgi:hypothetical protein
MGRITDAFADAWQVAGYSNFVANDSASMLAEVVAAVSQVLERNQCDPVAYAAIADRSASFSPAYVLQPPAVVAIGVERYISAVALEALIETSIAIAAMAALSQWTTGLPLVPTTRPGEYTPTRTQQLINRAAITALVRRSGALGAAQRLISLRRVAPQDGQELRTAISSIFGPVINAASIDNDGTVGSLRAVLTAAITLLSDKIGSQTATFFATVTTLPVHVAAHRVYQDAREAGTLLRANPAPHPTFMPTELIAPAIT